MAEHAGKPKVRFAGFTEAWEQRKLGDVADIVGGGTPSTNNPSYWNGDIDWYAPAEIGEQIFLTGSQKKITVTGLQKSSATILPVGSVLFTSRAGIGNTAILAKQGATNQGFQSIVPDSKIADSYFIFSRTHELKKYAETVGAGSTFTEVSGKQMARMPILMPKIDEQVRIGTFFRHLDRLVTLHQRKRGRLENIKKAMLEKMFPKNGADVPEIRFAGFTEAWEQRKFSDLVQIERGGSPRPIEKYITDEPNGLNWIKIGDAPLQGNYITKTDEKIKPSGLSKTRQVHPGDLILSNSMSFGRPYILAISGCIHDGWLLIRDVQNKFDLKFLCYLLGTDQMLDQYKALASGSTVNNLNKDLVGNTQITIPDITEQKVLGEYFDLLDRLITLHQRKVTLLQNIKKACLEKMFV